MTDHSSIQNSATNKLMRIKDFIRNNNKKILWFSILLYIIIFSGFSIYKYFTFDYIGLDLSIFNQVFFNSTEGNFFGLTIHPHSYLGDHFALILFFLLPIYFILKSSITLLILQSVILALCAWPLYLIAREKLSKFLSLFIALIYLGNVFVHNINSYEFHILPLAILFLFFTFYYYLKEKFGLFTLFLVLSVLVREDVSLVLIMIGILALIEKRNLKWTLTPLIIGVSWFVVSMKLTAYFSGYGQYKYILYYGWLGSDLKTIIINAINNPWLIIKHVFSGHNISFAVGLFLPFAFLPLLKVKYLLPPLLIFIQIILLGASGALALEIHYTSLLIPFLFISLIFAFEKIFYKENKNRLLRVFKKEKGIFLTILFLIAIYSSLTVGSLASFTKDVFSYQEVKEVTALRNDFVQKIPETASLATGFHFIPKTSSREKVYSLHYQYLGKRQYSEIDYNIPDDTEYLLIDLNDFLYYKFLYHEYDEKNVKGAERIRNLITDNNYGLTDYLGKFLLYKKNASSNIKRPYSVLNKLPAGAEKKDIDFTSNISLIGLEKSSPIKENINNHEYTLFPLTLYWQSATTTKYDYHLKISLWRDGKNHFEDQYPLSAFYPNHDWQKNEIVSFDYRFLIPQNLEKGDYQLRLSVYRPEGRMGLNKSKAFRPFISEIEDMGETNLLWITL